MFDVICLGILVADVIAKPLKSWPDKGGLVLIDELELYPGGCAANTGTALSKMGIKTGIIGKVGDDAYGNFLISQMERHNLDLRGVVRDPQVATSTTLVLVSPDGERSFIHYLGADGEFLEEEVDLRLIKDCKILHIAGSFLMPKLDGKPTANILRKAKEAGVITSLDTGWDEKNRWMKTLKPCLPYLDIFLPSIKEAEKLTNKKKEEDIAEDLLTLGIKVVGLKMGERGSYFRTKDESFFIPPYKVTVRDTTGAGDCFVAGFLAGQIFGWDLKQCGQFANALGAQCVQALGATSGIKSQKEMIEFMKTLHLNR